MKAKSRVVWVTRDVGGSEADIYLWKKKPRIFNCAGDIEKWMGGVLWKGIKPGECRAFKLVPVKPAASVRARKGRKIK